MDNMSNKLNGIQLEMTGEYTKFVEKFKPKKTTDDCYTPPNIYETVKTWAVKRYGLENTKIIRPFYPGGDYTREDYPDDCAVIDNPPFSIVTNIQRFYNDRGIRYFLFAPALTLFSSATNNNYVIAGATITYANGAKVNTSFVTNLGEFKILVAPDLYQAIKQADDENTRNMHKQLPKYEYPAHVASAARLNYLAVHGISLAIKAESVAFVRKLDAQGNKAIFGGGFLLSEKAAAEKTAAEKAAAEKAAAIRYELSEREKNNYKNTHRKGRHMLTDYTMTPNRAGIPVWRPAQPVIGKEEAHQTALTNWARMMRTQYPALRLYHHIPNGGLRDKRTAARLIWEGVHSGVPDVFIPAARGGYHGIYVELKVGQNCPTPVQNEFMAAAIREGYYCCVCYGWPCAAAVIEDYLSMPASGWQDANKELLLEERIRERRNTNA